MENKLNVDTDANVSTTPRSPRGTTLRTSPLFRPGSESAGHSPRNYSPRPDDTSEANSLFYKAPTTPRDEIEMKELKPSPRPSIRTQGDYSNYDTTYVEPKKGFPTVTGTPLGPEEKTSPKPLPHVGVRTLPRRNSVHPDEQPRSIPVPKLPLGDLQPRHGQFQRKKPPMRKVSVQTGVRESSSLIEPPRPYKTMQSAGESILIDFTNAEGQYEEVTATAIPEQADDSVIPATTFYVLRQLDDKAVVKMKEFGVKNPRVYAPDSYDIPFLVIIPCFNEGPDVLYRTILSVHESGQDLYGKQLDANSFGAATHAVILLDGYTKASSATIKWLSEIFSVDIPAENDPWRYLSRLRENKQEDKEVVNWFVDKADKTFCSIAGSEAESYVPSLSWNPAEVYKWVAQFNENTACVLLRNKINGDKLFRLKPDRLCDIYGLSLDDALELKNNIDRVNSLTEMSKDKLENIAVIFQRTFHRSLVPVKVTRPVEEEEDPLFAKQGCYWNCCDFEKPSKKDSAVTFLTVIIKCRNRQKHNSHWWAIQPDFGFVAQYPNALYTWFTDCGTLFEKDCLFHLWKALKRKPAFGDSVGAVTGRQRVMNARQQNEKSEGFLSEFLRHVQRCDFELSFASTVGAFATIGVLPVLPGPCALFKNEVLLKGANSFYHNFLHMTDIGLIEANVMIAEDRVLSVSPFFVEQSKKNSCCSWDNRMMTDVAPEACFYFESENNIMSLVKQRRRWINGTVAAYIWMLWKKPGLIWRNFNISIWRKICLWWLFFTQAYAYFWVFMAPSIFIVAFKIGIEKLPIPQDVSNQLIMNFWWLFLLGLYAIFSLMSSLRWVEDWAMYFGMFIGMIMEIITVASLAYNIVNIVITPPTIIVNNVSQVYYNYYDYSALGIVFIFMAIPFIAALFAQPKSLLYILRSCVPFFLFLPTLVGLLGVYSICNFSDFSWGNRDSNGAEDKLGSRARVLKARGNIFGWLFLLMNLIFAIVSAQLVNAYSLYKLAAAVVVFGPAITVVVVSMIYWICWRVKWLVMTCVHCGRSKPLPLDETRNVKLHNGQPVLTSSSGQPESERVSLTATLGTPHAKPGVTTQNEI